MADTDNTEEIKEGRRNSNADLSRIQAAHDTLVELGAECRDKNMDWQPGKSETLVTFGTEVKALDGGKVAGYLVRFSTDKDPDLTGDFFTKDTDFGEATRTPAYYHHGLDAKVGKRVLGSGTLSRDDVGVWVEAQLNLRDEYEKSIYEMAKAGKLGWSSGTASHLVERQPEGKANHITKWPLGLDASLTPTPAEPRNCAVPLKSLISIPEASEAGEDKPATDAEIKSEPIEESKSVKGDNMDEKELQTKIDEAVKTAVAAIPQNTAGMLAEKKSPAVTKNAKESPSFAKALIAWAQGDNPRGFSTKSEMTLFPEAIKGAWEGGTDNEGGYAVPDDFYNSIVEQRDLQSWVRQAPVMRLTTNRDRILIPTEATAATKMAVCDEEAAYEENEPVFGQVALTIYKFAKMLKISEELLDGDAVGVERYLASTIARAQAKAENYYCTVGTGSSMPQGWVYASTSSAVMLATADTLVASDLTGALATLPAQWVEPGAMGMVMNPTIYWYIRGLTGNPFQFAEMPQGSGNVGSAPSLFGVPVYFSSDCDAITVHSGKLVTYGNLGMYAFAERQGLQIARNPYVYQANGIVGIFAKSRFGAAHTQVTSAVHLLGHND